MTVVPILILLHLVCGVAALVFGRALGVRVVVLGLVPLVASAVALVAMTSGVLDGDVETWRRTWVAGLGLDVSFRLDGIALVMALLVSGIGTLVMVYCAAYFHGSDRSRVAKFIAYFVMFAGAMLGLVVAGDLWTLFLFWELTSVTSFLLIGLDDAIPEVRLAAQRALLVTGAGGLVMLGGIGCLVADAGSSDLAVITRSAPTSTMGQAGLALILIGAFTKSAQFPFHFWLPGAMAAPSPASAYLHSATMVKAGVLLIARLAPLGATLDWWRPLLVTVGGLTMLVGGVAALRGDDAKQSLAYGTVSQLGLLTLVFGFGTPETTAAGVFLLIAHALYKSALFLAIGAVEHATGSRSLSALQGVGRALPWLSIPASLCVLSMVGVPPMLGFVSKEAALHALEESHDGWGAVAFVLVAVGALITTAYSARLWWGLFGTKRGVVAPASVHHRPSALLVAPVVVLAGASLCAGVVGAAFGGWLEPAATSLDPLAEVHITPVPSLGLALAASVVAIAVGALVGRRVIGRPLSPTPVETYGERSYRRLYNGLLSLARRTTVVSQSGSLPVYVAVIFVVFTAALGIAIAMAPDFHLGHAVVADSVEQGGVAALAIVMSIAVVVARRRFVAVLLLGGVGQALTVLFLLYGAPDLALTQFMIESLMIVAFLLVLRHFPRQFSPAPSWAPRALRVGISVAVGITVAWFALAASVPDRATDVTDAVQQQSLPDAGGRNVVNVTIVDFRGVDTMFEITVFGVAALGVANLVSAARRESGERGSPRFARVGAESMVFDQTVRMIFHLTLLVSLYVMLRGHNAPGGGFAGGLIAGAAFVFRILAGSGPSRPARFALAPPVLIAVGMLLAIGSGLAALIAGDEFLQSGIGHLDVPFVGDVKLVSTGVFDAGVYLLVIGVVILVLSNLASRTHEGGLLGEARS